MTAAARGGPAETVAARLVGEADAAAEGLLGFVRMAVAAALGAMLALAFTSPLRPESDFLDRQMVFAGGGMASYFLIGLAAVLVVRAGRYRPWMSWATAAADVALISANLWASVRFAGISSLYAMVFPATLMIPLVLAFGALRFRPGAQVAATLLAVGLAALVVFSGVDTPSAPEVVARELAITYGVPPNVIRIVMILATGLIVALATWRARRLLERVGREAEARANLTRFLPAGIAADMSDAALADLRAGRRATLAIVFVDIRGFTALTDAMSPDETGALLTRYRETILDAAAAHRGLVDKFIGDGALLVFGLDAPPDMAARSALDAVETLCRRFDGGAFRIGAGVHLGEVVVGAVGDDRRLEFTVIGSEVNLAARIEEMTKETGAAALASAECVEAAGGAPAGWREIGPREARGRAAPVRLWAFDPA